MNIKLLPRYLTFFNEIFEIIMCAFSMQSKPQSTQPCAKRSVQGAGGYHIGQRRSSISPDAIKASKADLWSELVLLEAMHGWVTHNAAGGSGTIQEGLICSSGSPFDLLARRRRTDFLTAWRRGRLWLLPACLPRSGNTRSCQGRGGSPLKLPGPADCPGQTGGGPRGTPLQASTLSWPWKWPWTAAPPAPVMQRHRLPWEALSSQPESDFI